MVYVIQFASRIRTDPSWSCSEAVSKPVWHIPLLCAQWKTPDDGQRNCPKHVEFYSKNKFEKLVHQVGFILRIGSFCSFLNLNLVFVLIVLLLLGLLCSVWSILLGFVLLGCMVLLLVWIRLVLGELLYLLLLLYFIKFICRLIHWLQKTCTVYDNVKLSPFSNCDA